jgi:hypothetical protein
MSNINSYAEFISEQAKKGDLSEGKSSVSWARSVVGKGKSEHSGRGFFEVHHSKSSDDLESSIKKSVEKGKKTGDVTDHSVEEHNDGSRTHHIKLNPKKYSDSYHNVVINTKRPTARVVYAG